jgi:hypothetical protein
MAFRLETDSILTTYTCRGLGCVVVVAYRREWFCLGQVYWCVNIVYDINAMLTNAVETIGVKSPFISYFIQTIPSSFEIGVKSKFSNELVSPNNKCVLV